MPFLNLILQPFAWLAFGLIMTIYFTVLILGAIAFAIVHPREFFIIAREHFEL